jgi:hypothetical protein
MAPCNKRWNFLTSKFLSRYLFMFQEIYSHTRYTKEEQHFLVMKFSRKLEIVAEVKNCRQAIFCDSSMENKNASVKNLSSNNWKKFQGNFLLHTNLGASILIRIYGTCKLQCIKSTNNTRVF